MLEGNFDEQSLPDSQLAVLIDLLAWAAVEYEVNPPVIGGHRDYAATTCPGEAVYALIATGDLTNEVRSRIGEGPIELSYLRGEAALARVEAIEGA